MSANSKRNRAIRRAAAREGAVHKTAENLLKVRHGPGIWEDQNGNVHWSITELLEMVDLPDTQANRDAVTGVLKAQLKKARGGTLPAIIYRDTPPNDQDKKQTN